MNNEFDPVDIINKQANVFREETGKKPNRLMVSREIYRRLVELISFANSVGNLIIGCSPVLEIETSEGKLRVVIDEMLSETAVQIA